MSLVGVGTYEKNLRPTQNPTLAGMDSYYSIGYVDDTIIVGPNAKAIEVEIRVLGIWQDRQRHSFELFDEGEVGYFIGIRIDWQK